MEFDGVALFQSGVPVLQVRSSTDQGWSYQFGELKIRHRPQDFLLLDNGYGAYMGKMNHGSLFLKSLTGTRMRFKERSNAELL